MQNFAQEMTIKKLKDGVRNYPGKKLEKAVLGRWNHIVTHVKLQNAICIGGI